MLVLLAGAAWLFIVMLLLRRVIGQARAYEALRAPRAGGPARSVAVIIPARDEAANIGPCLDALRAQSYPRRQMVVLVVDDGSTDGTGAIVEQAAREAAGVTLHRAGDLPAGWLGKPHACWRGAELAGWAEWLCFMDADVRAEPDLLRDAVRAAAAGDVAMLSLHPRQELGSFWERVIVPAGMLMVACAKDLRRVNDPRAPEAEANGQFILMRRDAYFAVGGHAAVRGEVCEATALAQRAKRAGYRLQVGAADHLARTRMYRGLADLWRGFSKNAVEIMGDERRTLAVAAMGLLFGWATPLLPLMLGLAARREASVAATAGFGLAVAGSLAVLGVVIGTLRYFRAPGALSLLFPLGTTMTAALACNSVRLRRRGAVEWKGRACPAGRLLAGDAP